MVSRRQVVAALGGSAVVLGFDPLSGKWLTEARAATFDSVPELDGMLVTDLASRAAYAVDAGNIVHETPIAVLLPASVSDIKKMVRFCAQRRIKVAARGQGHTTFGQSQVGGGLVIDMGTLNAIHSIHSDRVTVDAGLKWNDLIAATIPLGLTPPVLTGFLGLSIGGTLSVGGISSSINRGAQVDHVKELEVVTGEGELKRCSKRDNRELFEACLAGLGQCAIITKATLDLVPAQPLARVFQINYTSNADFFADLRRIINRGEVNDAFMLGLPDGAGGWIYQLNVAKFFQPGAEPNPTFLLRGLSVSPAAATVQDMPYVNYVLRVDVVIDFFKTIGLWEGVLHPWFDVWLPDSTVEEYVGDVIPALTPEDVGPTGFLLLFPQKRSKLDAKLLRVPHRDEWVYLFDILTAAAAPGPDPDFEARMIARNRALFEQARALGGTRYPIGTLEFSRADWARQYGNAWDDFKELKHRFDPKRILAPGPGIF